MARWGHPGGPSVDGRVCVGGALAVFSIDSFPSDVENDHPVSVSNNLLHDV